MKKILKKQNNQKLNKFIMKVNIEHFRTSSELQIHEKSC